MTSTAPWLKPSLLWNRLLVEIGEKREVLQAIAIYLKFMAVVTSGSDWII